MSERPTGVVERPRRGGPLPPPRRPEWLGDPGSRAPAGSQQAALATDERAVPAFPSPLEAGFGPGPSGQHTRAPLRQRVADVVTGWVHRHRLSMLVLAPVLVVVGFVHAVGMTAYPSPIDDEGTYMAEAWSVQFHQTLAPYTYWYDHPPLGWIQLAGWTWLTDGFRASQEAVASGRALMLLVFLASAALVFVVARRLGMSRGWAALGVLVLGLSPLAVFYERMVYLDNLAVLWLLAAFALALTPRRKLWAFAASGACFAVAVLSKETVLIFAPALLWQSWQTADRRTRAFCVTAQGAVFLLLLAGYPLYALLRGELIPGPGHVSLSSAIAFQLSGRNSSGSPLSANSSAHAQVASWLHVDPWLLGAGTACLLGAFLVRRLRPVALAYLIGLVMVLRGGYLPVPYVTALLPFAALLVAGVADAAWRGVRRRRARSSEVRWRRVGRGAVLAGAAVLLPFAAPAWASGLHHEMSTDAVRPMAETEAWIESDVPHHDRLLVDDSVWVDLVDHGFNRRLGVVWFYKLGSVNNLDPSVARALPGGWRDFQYVVDSPSLRGALAISHGQLGEVRRALAHSTPVVGFGAGANRFEVRRIEVPRVPVRVPVKQSTSEEQP